MWLVTYNTSIAYLLGENLFFCDGGPVVRYKRIEALLSCKFNEKLSPIFFFVPIALRFVTCPWPFEGQHFEENGNQILALCKKKGGKRREEGRGERKEEEND